MLIQAQKWMLNYFKNTKQTVKLWCHMEYKSCNKRMRSKTQTGLVLHDSALTRIENLQHCSLKLSDNFQFNVIWHRCFVAKHTFCRRLAESDITVTPSLTYMDWLTGDTIMRLIRFHLPQHWLFLHKCTSHSKIQAKKPAKGNQHTQQADMKKVNKLTYIKCQRTETGSICAARLPQCISKNHTKNLQMSPTFLWQ
jgi:hypothetical protein